MPPVGPRAEREVARVGRGSTTSSWTRCASACSFGDSLGSALPGVKSAWAGAEWLPPAMGEGGGTGMPGGLTSVETPSSLIALNACCECACLF